MVKTFSYDSRCHDLAEVFLSEETLTDAERATATQHLAQHIQTEIEDWLSFDLAKLRDQ